jgi:hypothetical protein
MERMDALAAPRRRFVSRLAAHVAVRFHMGLIFAATAGAAVLASWLLMRAGVDALALRYGLAVVTAYLVFFLLVRAWIDYVTSAGVRDRSLDLPDVRAPGERGGEPAAFAPQGGRFGGAGASGSFDEPPVYRSLAEARTATARAGGLRGGGDVGGPRGADADWIWIDPDEGLVVVLGLLLVATGLGAVAVWLVWQAPVILPEAAFEALLASGLVQAADRSEARGWTRGVLRSTLLPFLFVLAAAVAAGWAVQEACPAAYRLSDFLGAACR